MNIVFLVFGDTLAYHMQTYFALLTVLRHKRGADSVVVYTDMPQYYNRLEGRISLHTLDKETLDSWINGTGYIFRAKIKAIEDCAARHGGSHILFLDGDTFLRGGMADIEQTLDSGCGIMYADEGHPSRMNGPSLRMWKAMRGRRVGGCTISMRHNVWNSGVIGIPAGRAGAVAAAALDVCDEILRSGAKCFTAEQYAFSVAMQEAGPVRPATPWVGHYWGNKEQWQRAVGGFITRVHLTDLTVEGELQALDAFPMEQIPLYIRRSNTQRRLTNIIKRIFKDKIQDR